MLSEVDLDIARLRATITALKALLGQCCDMAENMLGDESLGLSPAAGDMLIELIETAADHELHSLLT